MNIFQSKKAFIRRIILISGLLFFLSYHYLLAFEPCDTVRQCTNRALTLEVPFGKGAHYVDVSKSQALEDISTEMTIEFWMKPIKQSGKVQFIAGLWGPGKDKNDVWVLYISPEDSLVFELNGADTELNRVDNTIASTFADSLYGKWHHIAAVFDGSTQTASIYIDTRLVATARNNFYPISRLKNRQKKDLLIQIGSCNALSDNINLYRTFLGQMDEIRIWSYALDDYEIYCRRLKMIYNPEPGLALYYRLNEHEWQYNLCDASGNGSTGSARSGAKCTTSDRKRIPTFFITTDVPYNIIDTLRCDTTWSIQLTVVDTSKCGNRVWFSFHGAERTKYTTTPNHPYNNQLVLEQNVPVDFTITLNSTFLNSIYSYFYVRPTNGCDGYPRKNFLLTRITELGYSREYIDFDTINANCNISDDIDSIITIRNNTIDIGTSRRMTITDIRTNQPNVFSVVNQTFPIYLDPNESIDIAVRFNANVSPGQYFDTLMIISDDMCIASGRIPVKGVAQEIIEITNRAGTAPIDTVDFGIKCIYLPSVAKEYLWANLISENIYVDTIIMPQHFISKPFQFPVLLEPKTGYMPNYFRFLPTAPGIFLDSIIFKTRTNGCFVDKKVYVKGRGFKADIKFLTTSLDFGNIKVGQEQTMNATVENFSDETLSVSFYLKDGTAFFLTGTKSFSINPGQTRTIPISFIPISDKFYEDEICLFERRCFTSSCIPLKGQGYIERFEYGPEVMRTENVIGCQTELDTLAIYNVSASPLTLTNFSLDNLPLQLYSMVYPSALTGYSVDIPAGDSIRFIFRFAPNNVIEDKAERAYLRYETYPDGIEWLAKLFGTSTIPRIFVTAETLFGEAEVGDTRRDTIEIINNSPIPIRIDSLEIYISEGSLTVFQIVYPDTTVNKYLNPRDSIQVIIDFVPDEDKDCLGFITVFSSDPCEIDNAGSLEGTGIIIPLDIPMSVISFGFARPCDCITRTINLINQSLIFPRTIDSIWIDTTGIPNSNPDFFTWTSFNSPTGTLPYDIPKWSFDTLYLKFCPRTPAERRYVDIAANLKILASGTGWEGEEYSVFLAGKRQLVMQPYPIYALFPPTRVDTFSNEPQYSYIFVPELKFNPIRDTVRIDSITFEPDERVFTASDSLGRPFPIIVDSNTVVPIKIDFKPRAVRPYEARMVMHISKPCPHKDTTVLVYGESFAPAYGLDFIFELDTFRVNYCDTLEIKIYTSRDFPADVVDIEFGLIYDTTKMQYISSESPYLMEQCKDYVPYIDAVDFEIEGMGFLLKNFCKVDSLQPFLIVKFLPITTDRDTISIKIDSLFFDTEEVILFQIVAQVDDATIVILKPEMEVINSLDFGYVQVLDCSYDTVLVVNTGDVPIILDIPTELPDDVILIGSNPEIGEYFDVADTAYLYLRFCPRSIQLFDTVGYTESLLPCYLNEPLDLIGEGWMPELPVKVALSTNFSVPDETGGKLGDTVLIPIFIEEDFVTNIRGVAHWLKAMNFDVNMSYNKRALKYLRAQKNIDAELKVQYQPGNLTFNLSNVDSLKSGQLLHSYFLVTIPDSVKSSISFNSSNYSSDSLMFLEIIPEGTGAIFTTDGDCNIFYLNYSTNKAKLMQNRPNPWGESTTIDFSLLEKAPVYLKLYSITGELVKTFIAGNILKGGTYSVEINSNEFKSGVYFYVLESGVFRDSKVMLLIK